MTKLEKHQQKMEEYKNTIERFKIRFENKISKLEYTLPGRRGFL